MGSGTLTEAAGDEAGMISGAVEDGSMAAGAGSGTAGADRIGSGTMTGATGETVGLISGELTRIGAGGIGFGTLTEATGDGAGMNSG